MSRYWTIWPYHPDDPETLDRAWKYDMANGCIAIGWNLGPDTPDLTLDEISERIRRMWPGEPAAASMVWRFYHDISAGDTILAVRRRKEFVGIGIVSGSAFYDERTAAERVGAMRDAKANFVPVTWRKRGSWVAKSLLPRQTLAEITEEKYQSLIQ